MAKKNNVDLDAINETGRREGTGDRRNDIQAVGVERRKVQRRRQIDPTTCERDYSNDEIEFMQALDQYKRDSGRMFPTCSEILEVIRKLGYAKISADYTIESTETNHASISTSIEPTDQIDAIANMID